MMNSRFFRALALLCLLAPAAIQAQVQAPAVSATQTDSFTANSAGRATRGENITYTIQISNTGTASATGMTLTNATPPNTTLVPGSLQTSCVAFPDTFQYLGNVPITVPAPGVLANDIDPDNTGPALTATPITAGATGKGGTVTLAADGSFSYDPPAGHVGADTFTYTLNDNEGNTDTAVVTLTANGMIWFVNANAGTNGTGTLSKPFNNLASFQAINNGTGSNPKANDSIFLYESATNYTGGIALLSGQRLIGQDATGTLAALSGVTVPAGSAALPTMNSGNGTTVRILNATASGNGVTLNAGNHLYGFTAGNSAAFAIAGSTAGTLTVLDVSINTNGGGLSLSNITFAAGATFGGITSTGGTNGVSLSNVAGSVTLGSGSLSGHSQASFLVNSGTVIPSYAGSITKTSSSSAAVVIQNRNTGGGTISFSGAISTTGAGGVILTNNTGTTVSFGGGLTLSSGSQAAFTATGGGTVNVTGATNTINSTSGTGLEISNTTIGSSGVTFQSISTNGAFSGIVLNNTGSLGGLTVTGSGSTVVGGDNSGGIIQNSSGNAVMLTSTQSPSFTNMWIQGSFRSGIKGTGVTNFTYRNGKIDKSGLNSANNPVDSAQNLVGVSNIAFNTTTNGTESNLSGTVQIVGNMLTNAYEDGIEIFNFSGTIADLTVSNNTITTPTLISQSVGSGISIISFGSASAAASLTKGLIDNNTITNVPLGVGIQVQAGNANNAAAPGSTCGTPGSPTNIIAITNNTISGQNATSRMGGEGILALVNGVGQGNFNISGNAVSHTSGTSISTSAFGNAIVTQTVSNNTIISNNIFGSQGIGGGTSTTGGFATNSPRLTITVSGNNISQTDGNGILLVARDANDGLVMAKILNNTVAAPLGGVRPGIRVDAGNSFAGSDNDIALEISGNTSAGSGTQGIGLRKQGSVANVNVFGIEGLAPSPTGTPNVESHVNSLNPLGNGTLLISATSGFTSVNVPLLFAPESAMSDEEPAVPAFESQVSTGDALPDAVPTPASALTRNVTPDQISSLRSDSAALTQETLEPLVAEALSRWQQAGLGSEQLEKLNSLRFEVADLTDLRLAEAGPGLIRVDRRAAGNGWFIDPTPQDDNEYTVQGRVMSASTADSPSAGRVDLLTTLMHEMGHTLGLPDTYSRLQKHRIMYGWLTTGQRRLPQSGEAINAPVEKLSGVHYLSAPLNIGTLPAGKSITVTFQATINATTTATQISSQGTVSGTNFTSVSTDDPAVVGAANPTLTPVEQPPVLSNVAFSVNEDNTLTFAATSFDSGFSDANAADTLQGIRITSLPGIGILRLGIVDITTVPTDIARASLSTLTYVPPANTSGAPTFGWNATDGQGYAATAATATITINEVNDAPTLAAITAPAAILEDAGQQAINLSGISSGPANESAQVITVTAVSDTPSLIPNPTVTYTSADATGTLAYTPVANANGTAIITVTVQDNGGTANGGVDTVTRNFTVTVTAVNDAPTLAAINDPAALPVNSGQQTVNLTGISEGAANESAQTLTVTAVSNNTALIPNPTVSFVEGNTTGSLTYTPAANMAGTALITVTVQDNGGTANGGVDSITRTFTVTVDNFVSITATTPNAVEGGATGLFTFTRGTGIGVLVAGFELDASSTASAADFELSGGSVTLVGTAGTVTFPNGQTSVTVTLTATAEVPNAAEAAETVRLNVLPETGVYAVGTPGNATVTIAQNGFLVTNLNDAGQGSLRQAILNANAIAGADTILFSDGAGGTVDFTDEIPDIITLTSAELLITQALTLAGPGPDLLTIQRSSAGGTPLFRVIHVSNAGTVSISGVTVANGSLNVAGHGGGVLQENGTLNLTDCVLRNNSTASFVQQSLGGGLANMGGTLTVRNTEIHSNSTGDFGAGFATSGGSSVFIQCNIYENTSSNSAAGGIAITGSLNLVNCAVYNNSSNGGTGGLMLVFGTSTLANSTVSGNSASGGGGGGIYADGGSVSVNQSTITGNVSSTGGGGIDNASATFSIGNAIIAGNTGAVSSPDVKGGFLDVGHNLIGIVDGGTGFTSSTLVGSAATPLDPLLGPLADNGGDTLTHALLAGSPALNAGSAALIPLDTLDLDSNSNTAEPVPYDQRGAGFERQVGSVDLGSFELQKSVSILADAASQNEGSGTGSTAFTFTLTRSGTTDGEVTLDYAVGGTDVNAPDFGGTLPTGQVTIEDGDTTATLTINVSQDSLVEADEAFTVTLSNPTNDYILTASTASSVITNDDTATLSVATVNNGAEAATLVNGLFRITQTAASSTDTTVSYTVGGTATAGADYTTLSGMATLLAGNTTVDIVVPVLDDSIIEPTETVTVTLVSITAGSSSISLGSTLAASLNITDSDTATVTIAKTTDGAETATPVNALFTVTQTAVSSSATTLSYSVSGTAISGSDFTALSGSVTIAAGQTTATVSVPVLNDNIVEATETVILTLTGVTAGNANVSLSSTVEATASITDDDTATVSIAKTTDGAETATLVNAVFTVTQTALSSSATTLSYTVSGTATSGSDFTALSGSVTIPAGQSTATVSVPVLNDNIVEATETVFLTLTGVTAGNANISLSSTIAATANITDDDTATVSIAKTTDGAEAATPVNAVFTVTQTALSSAATTLAYTVSGTATNGSDFTALIGSVTIPAGQTTATVSVPVINDTIVESTETVILTLTGVTAGNTNIGLSSTVVATADITDNDTATVTIAKTTDGAETATPVNAVFTVTQTALSSIATTLSYTVSGTAISGSDFTALSGSVTIPAGQTTTTVSVPVLNDAIVESTETVILTLTGVTAGNASISLGSTVAATADITDDDTATVSIAKTTDGVESATLVNAVFTVTQTAFSSTATTLSYTVSGTATSGSDFTALSGSVTIPAGQTTAGISVPVLNDNIVEATETVILTLTGFTAGDADITLGSPLVATADITDDDTATVSIAKTADGTEATTPVNAVFTVTQTAASSSASTLTYSVAGTATSGSDFTALTGSVTIAAGALSADITVAVLNDAMVEATETVSLTLTGFTAHDPDVTLGTPVTATANITDNDTTTITLTPLSADKVEGTGGATTPFTFNATLENAVQGGFTVAYATADGTATLADGDYVENDSTLTFAGTAGETVQITVLVNHDAQHELDETFTVTLGEVTGLGNGIDVAVFSQSGSPATGTIRNDDELTLTIAATDATADENAGETGTWRVTRNSVLGSTTAQLQISATSTASENDWTVSGGSFASLETGSLGTAVIAEGATFVDITLTPVDDIAAEADETVILDVVADAAYTVGTPASATVTIGQNDFVVTNTNDAGEGSLRQAMLNANAIAGADSITFEDESFDDETPDVITLASTLPALTTEVLISGPGADMLTIRRLAEAAEFGLVQVGSGGIVELSGLTLTGGKVPITADGAGIFNDQGRLTVRACVISNNESGSRGGGIANNDGYLTVVDSTLFGNTARFGAGISNLTDIASENQTLILNSTLSGNTATQLGGGFYNIMGRSYLINTTVTGNTAPAQSNGVPGGSTGGGGVATYSASDTETRFANSLVVGNTASDVDFVADNDDTNVSLGGNVIGTGNAVASFTGETTALPAARILDPILSFLGGSTPIHALVNGSPAINAGINANAADPVDSVLGDANDVALVSDQRGTGFDRLIGNTVDAGSHEAFAFDPVITAASTEEDVATTDGLVITPNTADGGFTTHYQITAILNGTLYQNDGVTVIAEEDFITLAEGAAGLKFLPDADLNDPNTLAGFGFSAQAAVSADAADLRDSPVAAVITVAPVADTPAVTDAVTTINDQTTSGLVLSRNAVDGDEVTHFRVSNIVNGTVYLNDGTTLVADGGYVTYDQGAAGLKFTPATGFVGIASFNVQAAVDNAGSGLSESVTASIRVNYPSPVVTPLGPLVLNGQTGLIEQTVRVTNPSSTVVIDGFRLTVTNMLSTVELWNRTHPYLPIIEDFDDLAPLASRDVVVAYYIVSRDLGDWVPEYQVDNLTDPDVPELAGDVAGTYAGIFGRVDEVFISPVSGLGARFEMTITDRGSVSGKITEGKTTRAFTTRLIADAGSAYVEPGFSLVLPDTLVTLNVAIDTDSESLTGVLLPAGETDPANGAAVSGWRNVWSKKAPVRLPEDYLAVHNFAMDNTAAAGPQGYGYGTIKPKLNKMHYNLVAKLADGTALTSSSFYGPEGQILVYQSFYKHRGSCLGTLTISAGPSAPAGNTLSGALSWMKPGPATPNARDLLYREGFGPVELAVAGGAYTRPERGLLIMDLPATEVDVPNAALSFYEGGLDLMTLEFSQLLRISSPTARSLVNRVKVLDPNPNKVRVTAFSTATGMFRGKITLPESPARTASYWGLMVPGTGADADEVRGFGYFILPQPPVPPQTRANAPRLSGAVELTP